MVLTPAKQTIFAMPVFDFKNNWLDWQFRPVPSGEIANSSSPQGDKNPTENPPVISGYLWIYFATTILSMLFLQLGLLIHMGSTSNDGPRGTKNPFRRHVRM